MPFYEKGNVRIKYEEVGSGFPLLVVRRSAPHSGIEPILLASLLRAWARLGPLGTESQGTVFLYGRLIATL